MLVIIFKRNWLYLHTKSVLMQFVAHRTKPFSGAYIFLYVWILYKVYVFGLNMIFNNGGQIFLLFYFVLFKTKIQQHILINKPYNNKKKIMYDICDGDIKFYI